MILRTDKFYEKKLRMVSLYSVAEHNNLAEPKVYFVNLLLRKLNCTLNVQRSMYSCTR